MKFATPGSKMRHDDNLGAAKRIAVDPEFAYYYFTEFFSDMAAVIANVMLSAYWDLTSCTAEEISSIVYEFFYCNGWKPLEAYRGETPLKYYVRRAAYHHAFRHYDSLGYHRRVKPTLSNTKLAIARLDKGTAARIVNILEPSDFYDILWCHYVEGKNMKAVCKELDITPETYKTKFALAKVILHKTILASGSEALINLALTSRTPKNMSDVSVLQVAEQNQIGEWINELREIIFLEYGIDPDSPDYYVKLDEVVIDLSKKMPKVSERDRQVWLRRHLYHEPAAEVAKEFGIKESRVNCISSKTEQVYKDTAHDWFISMSEKYF